MAGQGDGEGLGGVGGGGKHSQNTYTKKFK